MVSGDAVFAPMRISVGGDMDVQRGTWTAHDLIDFTKYVGYGGARMRLPSTAVASRWARLGSLNRPAVVDWAVKYNSNGTFTTLGNLGGGGSSPANSPNIIAGDAAISINDSGVIVGQSYTGSAHVTRSSMVSAATTRCRT